MEIEDIQDQRIMNEMIESLELAYVFDAHWYPIELIGASFKNDFLIF